MKRFFLLFAAIALLTGCNTNFQTYVSDAEIALEEGDITNALRLYQDALQEKPDDSTIKDKVQALEDYQGLLAHTNLEWDDALVLANRLSKNEALPSMLQKNVKEAMKEIETAKELDEKITSDLKAIETFLEEEELDKASDQLDALKETTNSAAINNQLRELSSRLEAAQNRVAKQQAAKKARSTKETAQPKPTQQHITQSSSLKDQYVQKANQIATTIQNDIDSSYGSNASLPNGFAGQYADDWDDLLNDIWGALKKSMPNQAFEQLKQEQIKWIQHKEAEFNKIAGDGSVASQRTISSDYLADVTEERVYYLINNFMN